MKDFIIIKFVETSKIDQTSIRKWQIVTVTKRKEGKFPRLGKELTKEEALEMIKEHGLVLAHRDENGSIYDTPDRAFQKKHKGTFAKYSLDIY